MLSEAGAIHLGHRAAGRGLRAWLARRGLLRAGHRGSQPATDEVWSLWLAEPRDMWWEALSRWQRPSTRPHDRELSLVALGEGSTSDPTFRAALAEAAARHEHPIGQAARARILATIDDQGLVDTVCAAALEDPAGSLLPFCAEHGLLPTEPADRAAIFLLTGQHERYRATDPDGSLLALAYDGASERLRRRIQRSAVDAADMASVRVLTTSGPGGRLSGMTSDDVRYLTGKLAAGREWDELWRVAQQLPLLDAVHAVGLISASSDGWRPTGVAARTLFERLAGADVAELRAAWVALAGADTLHLPLAGKVVEAAFSPDGRRLAVVTKRPDLYERGNISVFELPSGRLVHRYANLADVAEDGSLRVVHHGDALLIARGGWGRSHEYGGGGLIQRFVGGTLENPYLNRSDCSQVAPHLDGFVTVDLRMDHPRLRFFTLDGDTIRGQRASLRQVRRLAGHGCGLPRGVWSLPGGRLALAGDGYLMVLDARAGRPAQLLAHSRVPGVINGVCAADPDHLITIGTAGVQRWRLNGGGGLISGAGTQLVEPGAHDPIMIDRLGHVAITNPTEPVMFLDATTLDEVDEPRVVGYPLLARRLWSSPSGGCLVVVTEVSTDADVHAVDVLVGVHSGAVVALADRPLAEARPADLARVGEELRTDLPGLPARPFLELLHACLEHRFAAEVALGGGVSVASEHDIALGGERR